MSVDNPLPSPWKEFLAELDGLLNESLELHCIGGFVVTYFYGFPRTTGDIDYYTAVPTNFNLIEVTGEGSPLHKKYALCLHKAAVTTMPENYESRLTEMAKTQFRHLRLLVPDAYDCILSKVERNADIDVNDAEYLFRSQKLDPQELRNRYENEFRSYIIGDVARTDTTLRLWIDIFTS
jgi:Nucleotidyltransferase of unknown function (DUF6036)